MLKLENISKTYAKSKTKAVDDFSISVKREGMMHLLISGHKYVEIAVGMKILIGTVKTRINISRSILKQRLKDYLN